MAQYAQYPAAGGGGAPTYPLVNPSYTGTLTTPLTASSLVATDGSENLTVLPITYAVSSTTNLVESVTDQSAGTSAATGVQVIAASKSTGTAGAGGPIIYTAGNSAHGKGGTITFTAGNSSNVNAAGSGSGGNVAFQAGTGNSTNGQGGIVTLAGGPGSGTGAAGTVQLIAGVGATTAKNGAVILSAAGSSIIVADGTTGIITLGTTATTAQHVLNSAFTTAAGVGTLTNVPGTSAGGNPTGYLQITINGVTSYIPFWQ